MILQVTSKLTGPTAQNLVLDARCEFAEGMLLQVLAGMRNLVIKWLRSQGIDTIAESIQRRAAEALSKRLEELE